MNLRKLNELSTKDALIAGGKGASLGELLKAGINVPGGFVVLTEAFDNFLKETDLNIEIEAILNEVNIKAIHTIDEASEKIQGLILAKDMPEDLKEPILSYFEELDTSFVAVRSSATAEDGASAAWAGQLDTFLNTTRENLLENIQRCWASLFTPRAIYYRFEKGMDKDHVSVAVVVQKMINSQKSGIAFSVHPVTQDKDQMIIEAGLGLGEAIVSGQVTPDSYVVQKSNEKIVDININTQEKQLIRKEGGGNEWQECKEAGEKQVLNEGEIHTLAEQIIRIENHYNFPVDIEWAFENDEFYITQSRPITTLSKDQGAQSSKPELELYQQAGEPIGSYQISLPMIACTRPMEKYFPVSYGKLWVHFKNNRITNLIQLPHMREVSEAFFEMAKDGIPKDWIKEWEVLDKEMHVLARKIGQLKLEDFSKEELQAHYEKMFDLDQRMWAVSIFIDALDPGFDQEEIKRIQEQNELTDEERDILLAPNVPAYITKFENALVDWKEGSIKTEELVNEYYWIGADYGSFAEVTEEWLTQRAEKAEKHPFVSSEKQQKEILEEKGFEKNPLQAFQDLGVWRDDRKILNFVGVYGCVRLLREGLRRQDINPDYVNFLCPDDVQNVFFGEITAEYLEKRNKEGILYTVHEDGSLTYIEGSDAQAEFKRLSQFLPRTDVESFEGAVACPGKVTGRVCYADTPDSETAKQMQKGDVLVTSMTRPEFVPLMRLAGAIVTDEGGISSHAAIVSREMNIPCVIGTKIATKTLQHGDLVEVDATKGIVRILERAEEKQLDLVPEDYTYYGFWKSKMLPVSYWAYSYNQRIVDEMGLEMSVPGSLIGTKGHVLAKNEVIDAMCSQWGKKIENGDLAFFEKCRDITDREIQKALKEVENATNTPISSKSFKKIDSALNNINFIWLLGAGYFVVEAEKRLQEKVIEKKVPAELVPELIPTFKTMLTDQQEDMERIREKAKGKERNEILKNTELKDALKKHVESYAWIETANLIGPKFTEEKLLELIAIPENKNEQTIRKSDYTADKELTFYLNVMSISGYIKQVCAEYFSKATYTARPFFDQIAKEIGITYMEFANLSNTEIHSYLAGSLSREEILEKLEKREETDYILYKTESERVIIENTSTVKEFVNKIVPSADKDAKELKGTTGNPGTVTGRASVVMSSDDFGKFKSGEILVATMTTPDFVVLMQKSAAIVTDIGGLLCHAAIVSRELNKPCVIGTRFATQTIKDGDLVEVNAEKGIIRILEATEDKANEGHAYRQVANRTMFLMACEIWDKGERIALPAMCKNTLYFDPLFSYKKGHGIDVYYNFTDPAQDPLFAARYFNEHKKELKKHAKQFKKNCKVVKKLTKKKDPNSIKELFEAIVSIWPLITLSKLCGDNVENKKLRVDEKLVPIYQKMRKESDGVMHWGIEALLEMIATKLPEKQKPYAPYLRFNEVMTEQYPSINALEKRKAGYILHDGSLHIESTIEEYVRKNGIKIRQEETIAKEEVRGYSACKGVVQGSVRLVLDREDANNVKEGDILVTPMTTPNLLPAMQKASAFVTDEGGVTCHAAIVAREMNKPCIIGTGGATKILQNGMAVEVNADKGIVRIL